MIRTPKATKQKANLLIHLDEAIVKESRRWVEENKGLVVTHKNKKYGSPRVSSEIMDCSMPMTFDHLSHCSLGCMYCFAYSFKQNNPSVHEYSLKAVDPNAMIRMIKREPLRSREKLFYNNFFKDRFLLHWGGLADPFCNFEASNWIGYPIIQVLGQENYPTLFSFKGGTIFHRKYVKLFEKYSDQKNFAFQISIVTPDNDLAKLVEPGVPAPTERIRAIKMLSDMGYWTILRLRPYIIGVTDQGIDELLDQCLEAGIKAISMEFFALDTRASSGGKVRFNWLGKIVGADDFFAYYKKLSPSERGGYLRLNRNIKEMHVKRIYKFCQENGLVYACSDPDFKELNMSGSCCGMPDNFPQNRRLENWSRNQLTFHLKELRRNYHSKGVRGKLYIDEVFPNEGFLADIALANEHVSVIGRCEAERRQLTQRLILQEQWNNLRSPGNPRNYFHGKVEPVELDDNGNLVFQYVPMAYEKEWVTEGIDLSH